MDHHTFLQDLAIVLCTAGLATIIFRQINQPIVLGYIIAGMIVGPHTPNIVPIPNENSIKTLAELGIIFLMFSLGLEFSLRKLQKVGSTAFIGAFLEILLMVLAGYTLGQLFGWRQMDSVFLGAILSISSTTIIIKALEGVGRTKERFANLVFGILIVEDILAIIMIALLTGFATTGTFAAVEAGHTILRLGAFLGVLLVAGLLIVPRVLNFISRFKSDEVLLISVIGICFAVSLITVKLGYSVALGAFLIGAIIAEAKDIVKIEKLMHPVRDMFSAIFFVSIGMLIEPGLLWKHATPILIISAVVMVGKVFACSLGTFLAGNDTRTSMRVGMSLAQIGEFSFIIAALGASYKVTSDFIYPVAVAVSALTTLSTPYLIKVSDGLVAFFDRAAPKPVVRALDAYTEWIRMLANRGADDMEKKILRKIILQISLNFLLVTGIFIAAAYLLQQFQHSFPSFPGGVDGLKAVIWLAAMLLSFPILIAIWRKMEVCAMIFSEVMNFPETEKNAPAIRSAIYIGVTIAGTGLMALVVFLLSLAVLPSWNLLAIAALALGVFGFRFYRPAVRLYAKLQGALHKTFEETGEPHAQWEGNTMALLGNARLEPVKAGPTIDGKKIVELQLRSETGATLIGIDRHGKNIPNPSANEILRRNDTILLFGTPEQLEKAKKLLG